MSEIPLETSPEAEQLLLVGDLGGSRTRMLLVSSTGQYRDSVELGTLNPRHVGGLEHTALGIRDAGDELLARSGYDPDTPIAAAVFGVAGVDTRPEELALASMLAIVSDRVAVYNDAMLPLGDAQGIAMIAGAGSKCIGRNSAGQVAEVGGHGRMFDEGGALWLGQKMLNMVSKLEPQDGRLQSQTGDQAVAMVYARATESIQAMRVSKKLTDMPGDEGWAVTKFSDLYGPLYENGDAVQYRLLHDLAPTIFAMANAGQPEAVQVVNEGARELASHVSTVAGRLAMREVPLIVTGSLLSRQRLYRERLKHEIVAGGVALDGDIRVVHTPIRAAIKMAQQLAAQ